MPIYEYHCLEHGKFEVFLRQPPKGDFKRCRAKDCRRRAPLVPSLTVMRPDSLWSGVEDKDYGYVTSESQVKAEMKARGHVEIGDRHDREAMAKVVEEGAKARELNIKRRIRKWSENTFGPEGAGLGGADGAKLIKENS